MSRAVPGSEPLLAEVGRFVRANLSSLVATGVDWALATAAILAGGHYLAAAAAGAGAGAVTDFLLKRHWAFPGPGKGGLGGEAMRYLAASGSSLAWNVGAAWALVSGARLPEVPGVILASVVVGIAWNYPLHRLWVFRRSPLSRPAAEPGEP